jgi:hypothetical protein
MKFIGVVILLTLLSNEVIAAENPVCKKELRGYSICQLAKANSEAMAAYLPSKIDDTTTLYATVALDNIVTIIGHTEYTQETLKAEYGGNSPEDLMVLSAIMKKNASQNVCNSSPPSRDFINAGGVIVYRLGYVDKTPLITYQVDKCD